MPLIYVFGDSHVAVFQHETFVVKGIGPATAYNLLSDSSTVKSKQKIFSELERIAKDGKEHFVMLVFGEIDCRIHINKIHKMKNLSLQKAITNTVVAYGAFLKELKRKFPQNEYVVFNILPSGEQKNIYKYPHYADRETRLLITEEMNSQLNEFCQKNHFIFIDIYNKLIDKNKNRIAEYKEDDVHYNSKIVPFIIEELKNQHVLSR